MFFDRRDSRGVGGDAHDGGYLVDCGGACASVIDGGRGDDAEEEEEDDEEEAAPIFADVARRVEDEEDDRDALRDVFASSGSFFED